MLMQMEITVVICLLMSNVDICIQSKKYQESIQSSTTLDPGYQWETDNFTVRLHKREPTGQLFPSR